MKFKCCLIVPCLLACVFNMVGHAAAEAPTAKVAAARPSLTLEVENIPIDSDNEQMRQRAREAVERLFPAQPDGAPKWCLQLKAALTYGVLLFTGCGGSSHAKEASFADEFALWDSAELPEPIEKAMQAVTDATVLARQDPNRPVYPFFVSAREHRTILHDPQLGFQFALIGFDGNRKQEVVSRKDNHENRTRLPVAPVRHAGAGSQIRHPLRGSRP